MNKETENLVLEHLRRIREGQDLMREDIQDLKVRMTGVEEGLGHLQVQVAGLSGRVDRVEKRLDRIEKRLDLVEA